MIFILFQIECKWLRHSFTRTISPGDKQKGYDKYLQNLALKKKLSEDAQIEARNSSIGIQPVYPIPKTYDEILSDNNEVANRLNNLLVSLFPNKYNAIRPAGMTF